MRGCICICGVCVVSMYIRSQVKCIYIFFPSMTLSVCGGRSEICRPSEGPILALYKKERCFLPQQLPDKVVVVIVLACKGGGRGRGGGALGCLCVLVCLLVVELLST